MRLCLAILALMCAAPLSANLLSGFDGKSETEIAIEFESGLSAFLTARLTEAVQPRMRIRQGREELYLQLVEVNEDKSVWQELVRAGWKTAERIHYFYAPFGDRHEFTALSIPPDQVAGWYQVQFRLPDDFIALAVWLASKGELMTANAKLAELAAATSTEVRANIDDWLCEKHGWTKPEGGLKLVKTHDLALNEDGFLLLTDEAEAKRLAEFEEGVRAVFRELEEMQGDVRGRAGFRRGSPKVRLAELKDYMARFKSVYGETKFMQNRRNKDRFERMLEAVNEDIQFVETEKYKAERLGIEGDWEGSAKAWDALLRADPENPELLQHTARAFSNSAKIGDAGRVVESPQAAKQAAELYDKVVEIFPLALSYMNYAGFNWLAAGDKVKARKYHAEVVKRTDGRDDLQENDRKNREYAEAQLRIIEGK